MTSRSPVASRVNVSAGFSSCCLPVHLWTGHQTGWRVLQSLCCHLSVDLSTPDENDDPTGIMRSSSTKRAVVLLGTFSFFTSVHWIPRPEPAQLSARPIGSARPHPGLWAERRPRFCRKVWSEDISVSFLVELAAQSFLFLWVKLKHEMFFCNNNCR